MLKKGTLYVKGKSFTSILSLIYISLIMMFFFGTHQNDIQIQAVICLLYTSRCV